MGCGSRAQYRAAMGQAFVILTGNIDISVGGIASFSGLLGALLMTDSWQAILGFPLDPHIAIPIMLLVATGWGFANGSLVSQIGLPALIVTLGMWQITQGFGFIISSGSTIEFQPLSIAWIGKVT